MAKKRPAKSKKRRTSSRPASDAAKLDWGGGAARGSGHLNIVLGVAAALGIAAVGFFWFQGRQTESAFLALAEAGRPALAQVTTLPNEGRTHLQPGERHAYATAFPTSGAHAQTWTNAGFYDREQPPIQIVHALEHGNVVIYYEKPGQEALDMLRAWARLYDGQWDGVVVTPLSGLGKSVVLTAWRKMLR
ncbi:MAG: DUF3105 domain-containing protein, partial [Alphaproteobacteria bacterium]